MLHASTLALFTLATLCAAALGAWLAVLPYRLPARWGWETSEPSIPHYARWTGAGLMAAAAAGVTWRWGLSALSLAVVALCVMLLLASAIDARLMMLPDILTMGAIWLGLLVNSLGWFAALQDAVWGAALGYVSLWLVAHAFTRWRGQEGMGHGDFKLAAAGGAWLGIAQVPWLLLLASAMGAAWGLWHTLRGRATSQPFPFGPFLAAAIYLLLVFADR